MSTPILNLAAATPVEIDRRGAELHQQWNMLTRERARALNQMHWIIEGRPVRHDKHAPRHWTLSEDVLVAEARRHVHRGLLHPLDIDTVASLLTTEERLRAQVETNRTEAYRYEHEYAQRPWPRYFRALTGAGAGHLHTSMGCPSCFPDTRYVWELQACGLSEAEAVALLGAELCTLCCPSAPVAPAPTTHSQEGRR